MIVMGLVVRRASIPALQRQERRLRPAHAPGRAGRGAAAGRGLRPRLDAVHRPDPRRRGPVASATVGAGVARGVRAGVRLLRSGSACRSCCRALGVRRAVGAARLAARHTRARPIWSAACCWSSSACCWSPASGTTLLTQLQDRPGRSPCCAGRRSSSPSRPAARASRPRSPGSRPPGRGRLAPAQRLARADRSMRTALVLLFVLAAGRDPGQPVPAGGPQPAARRPVLRGPPGPGPGAGAAGPLRRLRLGLVHGHLPGCCWCRWSAAWSRGPSGPGAGAARRARPAAATWPGYRTRAGFDTPASPDQAMAAARRVLRRNRFRLAEHEHGGELAGEKGYLREVGNLVFHLSPGRAAGRVRRRQDLRLRGPGHRAVRRWPVLQHRHPRLRLVPRRAARRRHRAAPFCVRVDDFTADYLPSGQPELRRRHRLPDRATDLAGRATLAAVPAGGQPPAADRRQPGLPARPRLRTRSPSPIRTAGSAPATSSGGRSTRPCCPRGRPDRPTGGHLHRPDQRRQHQLAVTGLLAPTSLAAAWSTATPRWTIPRWPSTSTRRPRAGRRAARSRSSRSTSGSHRAS